MTPECTSFNGKFGATSNNEKVATVKLGTREVGDTQQTDQDWDLQVVLIPARATRMPVLILIRFARYSVIQLFSSSQDFDFSNSNTCDATIYSKAFQRTNESGLPT